LKFDSANGRRCKLLKRRWLEIGSPHWTISATLVDPRSSVNGLLLTGSPRFREVSLEGDAAFAGPAVCLGERDEDEPIT
jgi:hypothetical protein